SVFGIPDDIHSVPGHNSTITERKDLNQFGIKFQGYTLLDIVNLSDLGNILHKAEDQSFEVLKCLCLRMLEESREDTKAGFQPMLGKVMVGEPEKDFYYEVQERATLENYATIWAKVLWIAWLAVMDTGTLHRRLELTADQTAAVHDLIGRVQVLSAESGHVGPAQDPAAVASVARLSTTVLRQQFEVVNRLLPSGESQTSQYLVPRAINLLSLRPNGSFLSYLQIAHITAAMRYALRSTMLYRVAKNDIDEECQKFLVPRKSTSFSYCVQVHAACNKFGRKHTVPTITWATDDF
ncbi:hypothetical protein V1527DRAFT_379303, partial [Lipomyces starkeyi]